ncbi:hypothetical protein JCGZ_14915 [Jatropha curcas]|uniref:Uncharacterized protein n=1 Tax=Jatropha curcas TaxID=180498 RepID=A0A067LFH8_JATCU|nr:hypothetical protein JCGZ_14915 [Jatropha curcas]
MHENTSRERALQGRERVKHQMRDSELSGTSRERVLESREREKCQMRDSEFPGQIRERAMKAAIAYRPRAKYASARCAK